MSYQLYQTVAFGSSKAGLTTVGYTLYRADGAAVGARVSTGVQNLGGGQFGASVTFPDGFAGRITWDTGEDPPVAATASVNTADAQDDRDELAALANLQADVDRIDAAIASRGGAGGLNLAPGTSADPLLVRAGIPEMDDCKILTRFKAFVVDQGVCATLEHVFRNRTGNPVDLSRWLSDSTSLSLSQSASSSAPPAGTVVLRAKEWLGDSANGARNPLYVAWGEALDAAAGIVRVQLSADMVERAGIYELNWGVVDETGRPVLVDRGLLSVERSLFAVDELRNKTAGGPPTLQEVRMRLMDSAANENLLLDDVEFKDEQILLALWEPVRLWNETPPPLRPKYTTATFPYRGAWMSGTLGQLHLMAANHYRRNVLRQAAGGGSDKDKEREYLAEGQRLWQEYTAWVMTKKVEINLGLFAGNAPSEYAFRTGW